MNEPREEPESCCKNKYYELYNIIFFAYGEFLYTSK